MSARFPVRPCRAALAMCFSLTMASAAQAHVKWFCGVIDPSLPPAALRDVLSPTFLLVAPLFATLVAAGALLDAALARTALGSAAKFRGRDAIGDCQGGEAG